LTEEYLIEYTAFTGCQGSSAAAEVQLLFSDGKVSYCSRNNSFHQEILFLQVSTLHVPDNQGAASGNSTLRRPRLADRQLPL